MSAKFSVFLFAAFICASAAFLARANSRASALTNHRPAIEQAVDRRGAGPSAAHERFADFDGDFARRPLRGHGECRLRNLRVAVRPVARGSRYAHRCARRFPGPAHRAAQQADALLRPCFQPRWQPHLRQHGLADRPQRRRPGDTGSGILSTASRRARLRPSA